MGEFKLDYLANNNVVDAADTEGVESVASISIGAFVYQMLMEHRGFVARGTVLGLVAFALISLIITPKYESAAQLMPPDQGSSNAAVALERASSMVGLPTGLLGSQTSNQLFIKILTSQTAEDDLIRKFGLRRVYRDRYWETARKDLEKNSTVEEDHNSGVIVIKVRDRNRERAQALCQAYVDELNQLSAKLNTSSARREREFLEGRLAILKQQLDQSSNLLGQFSSKNTTVDIPEQAKGLVEAAGTLQGQLIAAESELTGLKQIYGDDNIRIRSLEGRVAELRRNLRLLTGQDLPAGSDAGMPFPSIKKLPLLGVTYTDLLRNATSNEAIYESLSKQYELAKVQEAKDTPTVRLLDPPSYPERPISGHRPTIALAGALVGFLLALVWILWKSVRPEDPRKQLVLKTYVTLRHDFAQLIKRRRRTPEGSGL